MKASSRNKSIAIISGQFFLIGLAAFQIDALGILPIFIIVISFFTSLIHGWLYLSGYKGTDAFSVYQDGAKTKATALYSGFKRKIGK
ncbi:hypothetical protein LRP52_34275 [Photobacterium sp. ZSDE20]|uniref:Uncharacterized protein n=1 Tax=Photobacterium pectinilyticum TaxID=2906793 RepID=A0ABT1N5S9_9GAMM|nr:hypothetical protein [Photobacterium sp. ZSDE20]MCQ1060076.1 hypothetical protein [Photobacterium sp. ZSDE20]MDD1827255.1 hypothetical protein [Photobacterium sp. ZSDE20]